ncbi:MULTISPECIES: O-linked N-acetylglucosamine transferase family protein [Achromobacter]|uniref:O-GlcNAc transferase C-terminal domain-containing protein n=1 Tax=Achromobacter insolitus TaxID=217204 RepID=A0A6S7FAX1_9BURK|nr:MULTISPECIES: methyltransferase regulatory domain-containing protein [Achromobacter]MEB3098607.1 methyltransferase regulatory domain-containing protein [Achromobacter sp. D10]CAB3931806.1 hypothetical protein LMG6000_02338 [Achromobacter insolitus]CAB3939756.1 hypothetical protein LMG5997_04155 [Achromobacter insolitus]
MPTTPVATLPSLDRLRAAAYLYGIEAPAIDQARVLCIGMGSEPALTPLALTYPLAQFLIVSIGASEPATAYAAPDNLRYLFTSLDQIDGRLGRFDYILVPELYGYLPAEAATFLLQTCEGLLSPFGLACMGYPVYPGAKAFEIVRDAVLLHLHNTSSDASQELLRDQALAALSLFEDGLASANPLAPALREAADTLKADIQRGRLEVILNSPTAVGSYFVEFAQRALQAGLVSVGDAHPQLDVARHWGDGVRTTNSLLGLGQADATRQQYLDFASGRARRHTLLVRADLGTGIRTQPNLERLADLRWAGYFEPCDWRPAQAGQIYRNYQGRAWTIAGANDARLLETLAANWPRSLSVEQWSNASGLSRSEVLSFLRPLFAADMLHYCLGAGPCDGLEDRRLYLAPSLVHGYPSLTDDLAEGSGGSTPALPQWNFWGVAVDPELSDHERGYVAGCAGRIDADAFLAGTFDRVQLGTHGLPDFVSVEEVVRTGVLSKLWKSGLLAGSKVAWLDLLGRTLDVHHGKSACWSLYFQACLADCALQVPSEPGTPQEQARLDRLQRLLDELAYGQVESLARREIEKRPARVEGWTALVRSLSGLGRHDEALGILNQMRDRFRADPCYGEQLAIALSRAGYNDEAIRVGRLAMHGLPSSGQLINAVALACLHSARIAAAEQYLTHGIAADPAFRTMGVNLVAVYTRQGKIREGIAHCRELLNRADAVGDYRAAIYHNLLFFGNYDPDRSAEQIFQDYQAFENELCRPHYTSWKAHRNSRSLKRKLKIGYVSADFRDHAVARFLEPIFAGYNKSDFEVYAYANMGVEDSATARFRKMADHWVSIYGMKDDEAAQCIRDDGIDILVDMSGHTGGHRLGVFARKPAPVSLTWLGYGCTTGVSAIDYFLGNEALCPQGSERLFAEKIWRLQGSWTVYQPHWADIPEPGPLPAATEGFITFISLSRIIRINEHVIRCWARILAAVPRSRLVLNSSDFADPETCITMQAKFAEQGIPAHRLLMSYTSPPWHSLRHADIGLDCFPHNAGTTLLDMLCAGVPYVTLADRPSVGRIGSAPLHSLGHTEWIAADDADYVQKAVALASDVQALADIRRTLPERFMKSDLMDQTAFIGKLEAAYREMFAVWAEKRAGA